MHALLTRFVRADRGMTTIEYAVGTVAVAGFGGLLIKLLMSEPVRNLIWSIIQFAVGWIFNSGS